MLKNESTIFAGFHRHYFLTVVLAVLAVFILSGSAAAQRWDWHRVHGASSSDYGYAVEQTSDGGYIVAGLTYSYGTGGDAYLIKTDSNGYSDWFTTIGGEGIDRAYAVTQTADGGYVFAGYGYAGTERSYDVLLGKVSSTGDSLWAVNIGDVDADYGYDMTVTDDGGFVVVGYTYSYDNYSDVYLVRTDSVGRQLWHQSYSMKNVEYGCAVDQTSDGGFIITGETARDVELHDRDLFLLKTNSQGDSVWCRCYGTSGYEAGYSVRQTRDGGYIAVGRADSLADYDHDVYVVRTDDVGNIKWARTYGDINGDIGRSVDLTTDGGYVVAGYSYDSISYSNDVFVVRLEDTGDTLWTRRYSRSADEYGYAIRQTRDRGFIVAGYTYSYSSETSYDVYLLKIERSAETIRVPSQYSTIRAAMDASIPGDTILVAPGIYQGDGNRDLYVPYHPFVFVSESGPENTIIDCGGSAADPHQGIYFDYYASSEVVVDGFTIRGGYNEYYSGSAIHVWDVDVTIQNCIFENNYGHALYAYWSSPTISNCRFISNSGERGAAFYCEGSDAQFTQCTFENNSVQFDGGAVYSSYWSAPTFTECLFVGNSAGSEGGALYSQEGGTLVPGGKRPDEIAASPADPKQASLSNCTFVGNSANNGGAVYFNLIGYTAPISNCLFAFGGGGGAVAAGGESEVALSCCDIYGNAGGDWVGYISGQQHTSGNFSSDPLFCDLASGDYRLTANSPCAAANNSCGTTIGVYGVGCAAIELDISPDSIGFTAIEDETDPYPRSLSLVNLGGGVLQWSLFWEASWLNLSPTSGETPAVVTVTPTIAGLSPGVYIDTVSFRADDAVNSPVYVVVTMTIEQGNEPPYFVTVCDDDLLVEGETIDCEIVAGDPDGDPITFACLQCPVGAELMGTSDTTGLFSFQSDYRHVGNTYQVIVEISDADTISIDTFFISVLNRQLTIDTAQGQGEDAQYLYIDDTISFYFNEAIRESSLQDGCFLCTSRKAAALGHRCDNDFPDYRLLAYPENAAYLATMDTIVCTLQTCLLDSAGMHLDQSYDFVYYTGLAVYPGDANDDGIVDERDILPIGLYWGRQGPPRRASDRGVSWGLKPAQPALVGSQWQPYNAVHADADGSGKIDSLDICGVTDNWLKTYLTGAPRATSSPDDMLAALKQTDEDVLMRLYAGLLDCPESDGRAAVVDILGSLVAKPEAALPTSYELYQNYPNPFNPVTRIKYYLPHDGPATLSVYNIMGQKVTVLLQGRQRQGYGEVAWDGTDRSGQSLASGIYFYRLDATDITITKRMLLLK